MLRIILVEDHKWIAIALSELLKEVNGARIEKCLASDVAALDWLDHNKNDWDLAIVDLALGDGSGMRVLSACSVRQPHQKVVVLSNHLDNEMRRRCLTIGVDGVFKKADDIDALVDYCNTVSSSAPCHGNQSQHVYAIE